MSNFLKVIGADKIPRPPKPRKGLQMAAAKRVTVAQRLKELESFLTPELKQKISNMHNIEGDILTFNDRVQAIQESLTPTEKLKELQDQCVKMVRRVNKAHGDLFRAKSEQEGVNKHLDAGIYKVSKNQDGFIVDYGSKFNRLVDEVADLKRSPYLKFSGWFSWERAFWILIGSQAVVLIAGLISKAVA